MISLNISTVEGTGVEVVLISLISFAAFRIGRAVYPDTADLLELLCITGMLATVGWVGLLQILGLCNILQLGVVAIFLTAVAVLTTRLHLPSSGMPQNWSRDASSAIKWAVPFFSVALVIVLATQPGTNSYDSVHYQIPNAAHVLNTGSIRTLPFAQPGESTGTAPGDGALLLLATMLPFHTAALTGLVNLMGALLLCMSTGMLCRELGGSVLAGAIGGLLVVTCVAFFGTQMRSAYDDTFALLGLLSGLTFGLRAAKAEKGQRWLVLAGVCLGLAPGIKAAYLLPTVVVAICVLLIGWHRRPRARLLVFLGCSLALSVFWYIRTWVASGDPVFPESVRIGSWTLFHGLSGSASATAAYQQSLLPVLLGMKGVSLTGWADVAMINFGLLLLTPIAGLALVVRRRGAVGLVAAGALGCACAYALTPFSGSPLLIQANAALRFLLPAVALATVATMSALPDRWWRLFALAALAVNVSLGAVIEFRNGFLDPTLVSIAAAVAVLLYLGFRLRGRLRQMLHRQMAVALAAAALAGSGLLVVGHLESTADLLPLDPAAAAVAATKGPIAVLDVGDVASLLGPRLEGNVVAVGLGPPGAEMAIRNLGRFERQLISLHPALVVVGNVGPFNTLPRGWRPAPAWRRLGQIGGATVYRTTG